MSGALLQPSSFTQGGLIDDIDVTIQSSRFELYDYDGKVQSPTLALHLSLVDDDGLVSEQYYSAGDPKFFVPSKDGKEAVPVGSKTTLSAGSNAAMFLVSLVNAGYPEDQMGSDVSVFEGMKVHVGRVAQPKRSGIIKGGDDNGREKTVLCVTKIISMPGQAPVSKGKAATPKAAGKAAAPAQQSLPDGGDDLDATLTEVVMEALGEAGGTIAKKAIAQVVFKAAAFSGDAKARAAATKRVFSDEFLTAGPWSFDGTNITM